MIKLIHTADWHIGQRFYDYDRWNEHHHFLSWLREKLMELKPDVLCVAGDIFDTANPSAQAQSIYYSFLRDITSDNPELQVIITAGNHDSAARLEAPKELLESFNVTVRGLIKHKNSEKENANNESEIDYENLIIPIKKEGRVQAYVLAVPYLRQGDYPRAESYSEGVGKFYEEIIALAQSKNSADGKCPIIALGHLFATGAALSTDDRSERIMVGGLESVSGAAFDKSLAYTGLGHIHKAQKVGDRDNVRYAGAPLPMSFAEINNRRGVVMIEIEDDDSDAKISQIEYTAPVEFLSIPKGGPEAWEQVLPLLAELPDGEVDEFSPFLEVKILVNGPDPMLRKRIENALEGKNVRLVKMVSTTQEKEYELTVKTCDDLAKLNPTDIASDVYKKMYSGNEMSQDIMDLLNNVIKEIE